MSRTEKMKFIRLIEGADMSIYDALAQYDVPRSTYYRWKRNLKTMGTRGLEDNKPMFFIDYCAAKIFLLCYRDTEVE
jgi:ACT domain-containing protein